MQDQGNGSEQGSVGHCGVCGAFDELPELPGRKERYCMGFRLATKDFPPVPSRGTLAYYIGVLVLLGGILHFVPMGLPTNQG